MSIESLETFGTPEEVGARVLKVEQGKDGTLETKLFDARAEKQGDLSLYILVRVPNICCCCCCCCCCFVVVGRRFVSAAHAGLFGSQPIFQRE